MGIINKVTQGCSRWDDFPCQAGSLETGSPVGGRWKNPIPAEVCWYADDPVNPYNNNAELRFLGVCCLGDQRVHEKVAQPFLCLMYSPAPVMPHNSGEKRARNDGSTEKVARGVARPCNLRFT